MDRPISSMNKTSNIAKNKSMTRCIQFHEPVYKIELKILFELHANEFDYESIEWYNDTSFGLSCIQYIMNRGLKSTKLLWFTYSWFESETSIIFKLNLISQIKNKSDVPIGYYLNTWQAVSFEFHYTLKRSKSVELYLKWFNKQKILPVLQRCEELTFWY